VHPVSDYNASLILKLCISVTSVNVCENKLEMHL